MRWDNFKNNDLEQYCISTDAKLAELRVHVDTHLCKNLNCKISDHNDHIDKLYKEIVNSMIESGNQLSDNQNKRYVHRPGWNDYVSDLYEASRETRSLWLTHGKPRQGPIFEIYSENKMRYFLVYK